MHCKCYKWILKLCRYARWVNLVLMPGTHQTSLSFPYWAGEGRENVTNGCVRYGEASSKSSWKPPLQALTNKTMSRKLNRMWPLGTWFSGGLHSIGCLIRLNYLKGLFQLTWFCEKQTLLLKEKIVPHGNTALMWWFTGESPSLSFSHKMIKDLLYVKVFWLWQKDVISKWLFFKFNCSVLMYCWKINIIWQSWTSTENVVDISFQQHTLKNYRNWVWRTSHRGWNALEGEKKSTHSEIVQGKYLLIFKALDCLRSRTRSNT